MTLNYACIVGRIKLVLYDERDGSPTRGTLQEIFLGRTTIARRHPTRCLERMQGDERSVRDRRQLLHSPA